MFSDARYKTLYYGLAAVILLAPLLYLFTGHEWLYPPVFMTDAYLDQVYSYFYDQSHHQTDYYKSSRLPWLVPLFYLQKLVGPHLLMPVVICFSWVVLGLLYFILLKRIFGPRRGLLILPWIVFFPHLVGLASGGGLYNNYGAMIFMLLALLVWTGRGREPDGGHDLKRSLGTGFFLASAISINIVYVHLILLLPISDYLTGRKRKLQSYIDILLGATLGANFWGLINYLHGRPFFYFRPMIKKAFALISSPENQKDWWHPLEQILFLGRYDSMHLIFLFSLYGVALCRLAWTYRESRSLKQDLPALYFAGLVSLWIFWHATGSTALTPPDFSYPLQIAAFFMVAGWIVDGPLKKKHLLLALGSAVMLWLVQYASHPLQMTILFTENSGVAVLMVFAFVMLAALFLFESRRRAKYGYFIGVAFVYSMASLDPHIELEKNCTYRSESHNAEVNVLNNLIKVKPEPGRFLFYANNASVSIMHKGCFFTQVFQPSEVARMSAYIMGQIAGGLDFNKKVAELTREDFGPLRSTGAKLVLFPYDSPTFNQDVLAKVNSYGYETEKVFSGQESILGYAIPYEVYHIRSNPQAPVKTD